MRLLIFGLGYCGTAIADAARNAGVIVTGTARQPAGPDTLPFDAATPAIAAATHILSTVPPEARSDPVLARYAGAIATAPHLRWIGYLSSTVVYGNRDGGWVDEDTLPAPSHERGHRRLAAEAAWGRFSTAHAVDIFRLAGIYGPGRSTFNDLRAGRVRRILRPGHAFGRIHRDDIAGAVVAAMRQAIVSGQRIFNLTDNEPTESAQVLEEAAGLLEMPPPPAIAFADALPSMSPMARSFWTENRKVASRKTQAALGYAWRYPTYREGLRAILRQQAADHSR